MYFPGVELQSAQPIVYLVASPLFHPAIDTILRSLSRQLEIVRVGHAETGAADFDLSFNRAGLRLLYWTFPNSSWGIKLAGYANTSNH